MTAPRSTPGASGVYTVFGAPLDTGNLGVSALGTATLAALVARRPDHSIVLFDHGRGQRSSQLSLDGRLVEVSHRGAWHSRRLYRQESLWTLAAFSHLPVALLPNLRVIDESEIVFDITGGDSFTDLYGQRRFRLITLPKEAALRRGRPLVLLPQTYGPFSESDNARRAADIVASADQAWARDPNSYERLVDLLGDRFDPERHLLGVDVAFALPATDPAEAMQELRDWLEEDVAPVGINISGLLANAPAQARQRFRIDLDYPDAMAQLVARFLEATDRRILLIPHTRGDSAESDDRACAVLAARYSASGRVRILPPNLLAQHVKWAVSRLAWLCGARMHATIAGLSSIVPTAGVAYSDKVKGVFERCGAGAAVIDARTATTSDLVDHLWEQWERRDALRRRLELTMPEVIELASRQFDDMLAGAPAGAPGGRTR